MPNYNSTARMPFKTGGSVKKPKVKRIILWKGKAKDWPGAKEAARQTRNRKADGGIIGFKKGGIASESARKKNKEAQAKSIGKAKEFLKQSPLNLKGAYEGYKRLGKKAIEKVKKHKKKIKKGVEIASYLNPMTAGFQLGKKFRDKKAKGGKVKSVDKPGSHSWWLLQMNKNKKAKGGKADKNWIQGVNKSIKKRGTKGVCTGNKFGSA